MTFMNRMLKSPAEIKRILEHIRREILATAATDLKDLPGEKPRNGWRGADVIVTDDFECQPGWMDGHKLWVRTRHARPLGWLFRRVRDAFYGWYDFRNKHSFFGSLGRAALDHLANHQPEPEEHRPLLLHVLVQAGFWVDIIEQNGFLPDDAPIVVHLTDPEGRQFRIDAATGKETI
mgnify:CR=1 FL=1